MPIPTTHSIAYIMSKLLISLGAATTPVNQKTWPIYTSFEPPTPDETITIYDTAGLPDGRLMQTGEYIEHFGFQVRVRSKLYETGMSKANAIANILDAIYMDSVTIAGTIYTILSVSRPSTVLAIGRDPDSGRELFVVNGRLSMAP